LKRSALGVQFDATPLVMLLDGIDYRHVHRQRRWAPQNGKKTQAFRLDELLPHNWGPSGLVALHPATPASRKPAGFRRQRSHMSKDG